ncbi:MAG TPA: M23 family metallopeptidase [Syntrophorhabdaceae bacterium]|jgi:murein DD-endopeptidase MepM/ murein hydrolase activator NlpD
MEILKKFLKKSLTSVTIMVVPHSKVRPVKIKVSILCLVCSFLLCIIGAGYVASVGISTIEYYGMKRKVAFLSSQFRDLKVVMSSLHKADEEFSRLLSFKSKKKILENAEVSNAGALNIDLLKTQVAETIQSVSEIRKYIEEEKTLYRAMPSGWPIKGQISSGFGAREHPISGNTAQHTGIDIRAPVGTPVKATADGIVSFSSWHNDSGHIIVLEHGRGFTTAYAHNKANYVKVGQRVKRGEMIAVSGSTGTTTGPHLHYEVWKNGGHVNPAPFLKEAS